MTHPPQQPHGYLQPGWPQYPPQYPPPPRKTRTGLIAGIVSVVVLVVGALAITGFVAPGFFLDNQQPERPSGSAGQVSRTSAAADPRDPNLTVASPKAFEDPVDCAKVVTSGDLAEAMPESRLGKLSSQDPGSFAYCGGSVLVKNEKADIDVRVGQLSLSVTRDFAVEKDAERTTFGGSTAVETQDIENKHCGVQVAIHPEGRLGFGAGLDVKIRAYTSEMWANCLTAARTIAEIAIVRLPDA